MTDLIDEGDGPVLVFLHGAGVDNQMWEPQRVHFRTSHRVIIPNLPGHGGVAAVSNVAQMAEAVHDRLQALGLHRYAVVGLSLGGMAALEMAARWPDEVTHLALIEAVPTVSSSPLMRRIVKACLWPTKLIPPRWTARLPVRHLGAESPASATYLKAALPRLSAAQTHALLTLAMDYDGRPHLPRLTLPCLVMVGALNTQTHKRARAMAQAISGCAFKAVPDAGHIANLDAPGAVNDALTQLFSRTAARA